MRARWKLAAFIATLAVVAGILWAAGATDFLRDRDRVEEFLTDSGPLGPLVFIFGFVALQPFSLPGALLIIPGTFVWPWWQVTIYSLCGGMVASVIGFAVARWLGQEWVADRLPKRFGNWEQRLADHGFGATVALRLAFGYAPAADWLLGVSRVGWTAFLAGTLIGLAPTTILMAVYGDEAVRGSSPASLLIGVAAVACVILLLKLRARRRAEVSAGRVAGLLPSGDGRTVMESE